MNAERKAVAAVAVLALTASWCASALAADNVSVAQAATSDEPLRERFKEACGADIETYCSIAETKNERLACIAIHSDEFSSSCRAFFELHMPKVVERD